MTGQMMMVLGTFLIASSIVIEVIVGVIYKTAKSKMIKKIYEDIK